MPSTDTNRTRRRLTWRLAALWMVVLALGLAVTGMVLALQHARWLATLLMAPAEAHAARIALEAARKLDRQLLDAFELVEEHIRARPNQAWVPPRGFPTWLDGLFMWDGKDLSVIVAPVSNNEVLAIARSRFAALSLMASDPSGGGLDATAGGGSSRVRANPRILYDSLNGEPVVFSYVLSTHLDDGHLILLASHLDLERLRTDLIEPLLPADAGLELVRAKPDEPYDPWSQRLSGPMRYWTIKPSEALAREQTRAVVGQTLVYMGLTVLALATLLVAMWVLVRVVRREMALAEMKANFVADVSHELKTPLALINMFAETLQSGRVISEEKRREYYAIIIRESTRLANLIENILDFARIDAGRKEYHLEPVAIEEVVRETYDAYRLQLDHHQFEHHLTIAPSLPLVDADRDAVVQALINLINNAIKYAGEERYIAIDVAPDTRRGRHGVLISVHDRGIGIQPEDRRHVMDGFFRSSDDRVRAQGGTGLGLALVKHIVDAHRGSLDVESRLVKGSTFRIFLPASERPTVTHGAV